MNNPELYGTSSLLAKIDAHTVLSEYSFKMKWKKFGDRIIDVGCADGSVTAEILPKYLPPDYERLDGCDMNKNMVDFANEHFINEKIKFLVLDIEKELPEDYIENYNHVFSFFTLHWFRKPRIAFQNFFKLLMNNGECLTTGFAWMPFFEAYRILSLNKKWSVWLRNVEQFVSLYQDCKDPASDLSQLMVEVGFKNVKVVCTKRNFVFDTVNDLKDSVTAVNPFDIPQAEFHEYKEEFLKVLLENDLIQKVANKEGKLESLSLDYMFIVGYGSK